MQCIQRRLNLLEAPPYRGQESKEFLQRVVAEIATAGAILIVGPGSAKTELRTYAGQFRPDVAARIRGVQPLDHPTDGQLLAHGRKFFVADDCINQENTKRVPV